MGLKKQTLVKNVTDQLESNESNIKYSYVNHICQMMRKILTWKNGTQPELESRSSSSANMLFGKQKVDFQNILYISQRVVLAQRY